MNLRSILWKLPLSYAGIALLTTLALGVALLLPLRAYYREHELAYLKRNAESIAVGLAPLLNKDAPEPVDLESHIQLLAFLSQARVRLVDMQGQQLTDSGRPDLAKAVQLAAVKAKPWVGMEKTLIKGEAPGDLIIRFGSPDDLFFQAAAYPEGAPTWETTVPQSQPGQVTGDKTIPGIGEKATAVAAAGAAGAAGADSAAGATAGGVNVAAGSGETAGLRFFFSNVAGPPPFPKEVQAGAPQDRALVSVIPVSKTMYGFELQKDTLDTDTRSDQVFRQPLTGKDGKQVGWVELSDGPAYGRQIVDKVARAWLLASLVAVLVAASAGWWTSRRMTAPLLALTTVTRRMAGGDLSARASFSQKDEFGSLGQAFNDMAGRIETTVSTLLRFAGDAAHELHTPLTALRTNLELAEQAADPRAYIQRAAEQVARLEHLTNDLLALSRIEGGSPGPEPAPLDLAGLVARICEPFAAQAEQAGINFELSLPAGPIIVEGQEGRLSQALCNLVDNALKFTPQNGRVAVGLRQEGDRAVAWVEDSGIGIEPDDLAGLFQRFHRGRNAASYPGSGLGLSIVKAVVDRHGGQVQAESSPGRTRFTLALPLRGVIPQ